LVSRASTRTDTSRYTGLVLLSERALEVCAYVLAVVALDAFEDAVLHQTVQIDALACHVARLTMDHIIYYIYIYIYTAWWRPKRWVG
jgi:hypothetical protein